MFFKKKEPASYDEALEEGMRVVEDVLALEADVSSEVIEFFKCEREVMELLKRKRFTKLTKEEKQRLKGLKELTANIRGRGRTPESFTRISAGEVAVHLRSLGAEVSSVEVRKPEVGRKRPWTRGKERIYGGEIGCIEFSNHPIREVEITYERVEGSEQPVVVGVYWLHRTECVTRSCSDPPAPPMLGAEIERKTKGLVRRELQDFKWVGGFGSGPLVGALNADQALNSLVFECLKEPGVEIEVRPDREAGCHRISVTNRPSPEDLERTTDLKRTRRSQFEALTRIAEHIHSLEERTPRDGLRSEEPPGRADLRSQEPPGWADLKRKEP